MTTVYLKSTKKVNREGIKYRKVMDNVDLDWKDMVNITKAVNTYCKERIKAWTALPKEETVYEHMS